MSNKKFNTPEAKRIHDALAPAYEALNEKKYNATTQLSCYLLSEDPCYITPHNNARKQLTELDREEMITHLLKYYFDEQL